MRGEFVDVGGARLYYYAAGIRGAGEPILFLHGFPTSSHLWRHLVPLMPEGHRTVVVDLLGFGRSDHPQGRDLSLRGHAERVIALLDALHITYVAVVGHDVGGGIAQHLAVHHPTRVSRLCLIDSVAFDDWPTRDVKLVQVSLPLTRLLPATWILGILKTDLVRGYAESGQAHLSIEQYVKPFGSPEGRDMLVEHLAALNSRETVTLGDRLKHIVAPTAVIWGAHDPFLPSALGRRLHESIPNSTFDIIPDVRHFTPEETPERIATIAQGWLSR